VYGLSTTTDLGPLVGCTLTFIGFGEYQLQLGFTGDADCSISIEAEFSVARNGFDPTTYSEPVAGAPTLLPLLGREVTSALVPNDGTVQLIFDDGSMVEVLDSDSEYESYAVRLGGVHLII
jgi:hypothetical protein